MTKRYNLDTDRNLGGLNPSDQSSPSQKAVKQYVDENAGGYRFAKTAVSPDPETGTVVMSELYGGVDYMDSCVEVDTPSDVTVVVDEMPQYRSVFVVNNTSRSAVEASFDLESLGYESLNCDEDCVSSLYGITVEVLPGGARTVEMFLIGDVMNVYARDMHMDSHGTLPELPQPLAFTAVGGAASVSMVSTMETPPSIEWSEDGETWNAWTHTSVANRGDVNTVFDTISLGAGETVYLRGVNPGGLSVCGQDGSPVAFSSFVFGGGVAASGTVQSLVDGDGLSRSAVCMAFLFGQCSSLTSAPELPATQLSEACYAHMFHGCTSLEEAPGLPATVMAAGCYVCMFNGCTSLEEAPELPATAVARGCYGGMFEGCTSLTGAPDLPATVMYKECYDGMFAGCTALTAAPALPATALAGDCYMAMFRGCTSLEAAPDLPASALEEGCYSEMFKDCAFDMSDDGETFNFACGIVFPYDDGELVFDAPENLAEWTGNKSGFETVYSPFLPGYTVYEPDDGTLCVSASPASVVRREKDGGGYEYISRCAVFSRYSDDEDWDVVAGSTPMEAAVVGKHLVSDEYTGVMRERLSRLGGYDGEGARFMEYLDHYRGWYLMYIIGTSDSEPAHGGALGVYPAGSLEPYAVMQYGYYGSVEDYSGSLSVFEHVYGSMMPSLSQFLMVVAPPVPVLSIDGGSELMCTVAASIGSEDEVSVRAGGSVMEQSRVEPFFGITQESISEIREIYEECGYLSDERVVYVMEYLNHHVGDTLYIVSGRAEGTLPENGSAEILVNGEPLCSAGYTLFGSVYALYNPDCMIMGGRFAVAPCSLGAFRGETEECLTVSPLLCAGDGVLEFSAEICVNKDLLDYRGQLYAEGKSLGVESFFEITGGYVESIPKGLSDEMDDYRNFMYDRIGMYRKKVSFAYTGDTVPEYVGLYSRKEDSTNYMNYMFCALAVPGVIYAEDAVLCRNTVPDWLRLTAKGEDCRIFVTTILKEGRGTEPDLQWSDDMGATWHDAEFSYREWEGEGRTSAPKTVENLTVYKYPEGLGSGEIPPLFISEEHEGYRLFRHDGDEYLYADDSEYQGDTPRGVYGVWDDADDEFSFIGYLDPVMIESGLFADAGIEAGNGETICLRGVNPGGTGELLSLLNGDNLMRNMTGITLWGKFDVAGRLSSLVDGTGTAAGTRGASFAGLFSNYMFTQTDDENRIYVCGELAELINGELAGAETPEEEAEILAGICSQIEDASGLILPESAAPPMAYAGMFCMQFGMTGFPDIRCRFMKADEINGSLGVGFADEGFMAMVYTELGIPLDTPVPKDFLGMMELIYEYADAWNIFDMLAFYSVSGVFNTVGGIPETYGVFEAAYLDCGLPDDVSPVSMMYMNLNGPDSPAIGSMQRPVLTKDGETLAFGGIAMYSCSAGSFLSGSDGYTFVNCAYGASLVLSLHGFGFDLKNAPVGFVADGVAVRGDFGMDGWGGFLPSTYYGGNFSEGSRIWSYVGSDSSYADAGFSYELTGMPGDEGGALSITAPPLVYSDGSPCGFVRWEKSADGGETWTATDHGSGRTLGDGFPQSGQTVAYRAVYSSDAPVYVAFSSANGGSISASSSGDTLSFETSSTPDFANPVQTGLSDPVQIAAGGTLYVRAAQQQEGIRFSMTGDISVSGTAAALFGGITFNPDEMFENCTSLTDASGLSMYGAVTCKSMFWGCTSLNHAPAVLPATTLTMSSCYSGMFGGCTSLTAAPVLPATTLADSCYYGMFVGCTSLTAAPALPATIMRNFCYQSMFQGCTSLGEAPELPAWVDGLMTENCYESMFEGCSSLENEPSFPNMRFAGNIAMDDYFVLAFNGIYRGSGITGTSLFSKVTGYAMSSFASAEFDASAMFDCVTGVSDKEDFCNVCVCNGYHEYIFCVPGGGALRFAGGGADCVYTVLAGGSVEPVTDAVYVNAGDELNFLLLDTSLSGYLVALHYDGCDGCWTCYPAVLPVDASGLTGVGLPVSLKTDEATGEKEVVVGGLSVNEGGGNRYTGGSSFGYIADVFWTGLGAGVIGKLMGGGTPAQCIHTYVLGSGNPAGAVARPLFKMDAGSSTSGSAAYVDSVSGFGTAANSVIVTFTDCIGEVTADGTDGCECPETGNGQEGE